MRKAIWMMGCCALACSGEGTTEEAMPPADTVLPAPTEDTTPAPPAEDTVPSAEVIEKAVASLRCTSVFPPPHEGGACTPPAGGHWTLVTFVGVKVLCCL